jgi:hypothetical protein
MSTRKSIAKMKYATTILIKCKSPPLTHQEIFTSIFFKSMDAALKALKFFTQIVETGGIRDREWRKTMEGLGMDRGTYYHMLSKLRGVGLIEKREGAWVPAAHYRSWLEQALRQIAAMNGMNAIITYDRRE